MTATLSDSQRPQDLRGAESLSNREPLLHVVGLCVEFPHAGRIVRAVDDISFQVGRGESLALVGESGAGKSVTALALLDLVPVPGRITAGQVIWKGADLRNAAPGTLQRVRGRGIAMIFQNPQASLVPVYTVGRQLRVVIQTHTSLRGANAHTEVVRLLREVQLPDPERIAASYPWQLSGGMCQRVMIAMALACSPELLIADEPTSSLDVTTQAGIVRLLQRLQEELGMALLFVSHDLGTVAQLCDRVAVMYRGRIVETGTAPEVYGSPEHPYTRLLLDSVPVPDPTRRTARARADAAAPLPEHG